MHTAPLILAATLTGCHHVPAIYEAPINTWENQ